MPKEVLTEIHNKLCYVDWAIYANNKIQKANQENQEVFFKERKGKVSKYRESIINVIGHAIADCVTRQKEFEHTTLDGKPKLITFKADPQLYKREHWNAVILYNLVEAIIHSDMDKYPQTMHHEIHINEVMPDIKQRLMECYKDSGIKDLGKRLDDSIADIKKYNDQLNLDVVLSDFNQIEVSDKKIQTMTLSLDKSSLDQDYEDVIEKRKSAMTFEWSDLDGSVSLNPKHLKQPAISFNVTLQWNPKNKIGEQWSLQDNNSFVFQGFVPGHTKQGSYKTVFQFYNINYFNWLIQFIECDLELDASKERDWRYWALSGYYFDYKGKKVNIRSINEKDPQYGQRKYDPNDKAIIEKYYTSYKTINPHKRPLPVAD